MAEQSKEESTGAGSLFCGVAKGVCGGLLGLSGLLFILFYNAYLVGIPLASIVIGALYLDDCPLQRLIPVYLIVSGVLGPVIGIFERCRSVLCTVESEPEQRVEVVSSNIERNWTTYCKLECNSGQRVTRPDVFGYCGYFTVILLGLVWTGVFILGNVLVYGTYDVVSSNSTSVEYCHPTAYYFTFWSIATFYITIGITLILFSCCFAVGVCCVFVAKE